MSFLDHTQRSATFGRTPLNEWSVRRRDLYLTTHNTHNRQIFMPRVGFDPTISEGERPKTYALDIHSFWLLIFLLCLSEPNHTQVLWLNLNISETLYFFYYCPKMTDLFLNKPISFILFQQKSMNWHMSLYWLFFVFCLPIL